jgi:uncharacterized membrane protein YphA (DoxX/SURF4 family)
MNLQRSTAEKILSIALRLILGGVFVFAGALKIYDPGRFALDIANYRLVPHELINLFAITLPWVEVLGGFFLLFGLWLRASALIVLAMTIMFFLAISSALTRGLDIECGCFGTVGGRRIGLMSLLFDTGLLCMAGWLTWSARKCDHPAPPAVPSSLSKEALG